MEMRVSKKNPDGLTIATRRLKPAARELRDDAWRYRAMMEFAAYGWTQASLMAEQVVSMLSRRTEGELVVANGDCGPAVFWLDDLSHGRCGPVAYFGLTERVMGLEKPSYARAPKRPEGNWATPGAFG